MPDMTEKEMRGVPRRTTLAGKEVSLTGRLISMDRAEAVQRIVRAGGRHVSEPDMTTELLVAGQATGHFTPDGGIARNMLRFRELKKQGAPIRLVDEAEFLGLIGAEGELTDTSRMYTAAQVSRIVEEPLSVVRGWMRRGLLQPARVANRLAWFEFQDILLARNLGRLTASGVTTAQVRQSLSEIAQWVPDGEQIAGRLEAYDRGLRIRLLDGGWAEPSGQRLMDFDAERDRGTPRVSVFPESDQSHGRWFTEAVEAEERGDLRRAADAYTRALQAATDPETLFNLGNVLYEMGREADAAERYLQAIESDRGFAEAWNNLGNCLVAIGKHDEGIHAYQTALSIEPRYPDAHCNLAIIYARTGQHDKALPHRAECLRAFPSETHLTLLRNKRRDEPDD